MSCNCNKAHNTGSCIANFTIGTAAADTDYNVYFQTPTGRTDMYAITSASDGKIVVETPRVRIGETYQVWISQPDQSTGVQLPFTVEETEVSCINICFTECFEDDEYLSPVDRSVELV